MRREKEGQSRKLILGIFLLFALSFLSFSQEAGKYVYARVTSDALLTVKPPQPVTVAFRVGNKTADSHDFLDTFELPEKWKIIGAGTAFRLGPGEETVRLIGFFIPLITPSGDYQVHFSVKSVKDPMLEDRVSFVIRVLKTTKVAVLLLESPEMVIAGEEILTQFQITNQGNDACSVSFDIQSSEGYHSSSKKAIRLDPGQSQPVRVETKTEAKVRFKIKHSLQLVATVEDSGPPDARATAFGQTDIIPQESGEGDYFRRMPTHVKFLGFSGSGLGSSGQIEFSGNAGALWKGVKAVDFMFRGPGKTELMTLGFYSEEYYFSLAADRGNVFLGDKVFFLSKLSEYGCYGRGIEGTYELGDFSFKGYARQSLFTEFKNRQAAFQLVSTLIKRVRLSLNYLSATGGFLPQGRIWSFEAQYSSNPFNFNLEYAGGRGNEEAEKTSGSAFWLDAYGDIKDRLQYRLDILRGSPGFPGSYSDLSFNSARISYRFFRNFSIRGAYSDMKKNLEDIPDLFAEDEKYAFLGFQYRPAKNIDLSLDYKYQQRISLFPEPQFDYTDRSLRIGIAPYFGTFNMTMMFDLGQTKNRLTGGTSRLFDFSFSGTLTLFGKLSLGGYLQLRNQENHFIADEERMKNINVHASLNLGRTVLYAFYRESRYYEFFERVLQDRDMVERLLFNHFNVLELSVSQKLFEDHSLALRLRLATSSLQDPVSRRDNAILVEYTIPLAVPVGREKSLGAVKGRVTDAENDDKGMAGVVVQLNDRITVTNKDGNFVFHNVASGPGLFNIAPKTLGPNHVPLAKTPMEIHVDGGRTTSVDVGIVRSVSVSGQVMAHRFGEESPMAGLQLPMDKKEQTFAECKPLSNVLVRIASGEFALRQITDERGFFQFDGLRPGTWNLQTFDGIPDDLLLENSILALELSPGDKKEVLLRAFQQTREIKLIKTGTVTLQEIGINETETGGNGVIESLPMDVGGERKQAYYVRVASFRYRESAEIITRSLQKEYRDIFITVVNFNGSAFHVVRIPADDLSEAQEILRGLGEKGYLAIIEDQAASGAAYQDRKIV